MSIKFIPKNNEFIGLSVDDKSSIVTDGAIIYYTDTETREIYHSGLWTPYTLNTDTTVQVSDIQIGAVEIKNATSEDRLAIDVDGSILAENLAISRGGFVPEPGISTQNLGVNEKGNVTIDSDGNLATRGAITTDEGGFRDGFTGIILGKSIGTATFTNGSITVTGTGFTGSNIIQLGDFLKLNTDAETAWGQVAGVISDTEVELDTAYTGVGGTGTSTVTKLKPSTGTGGGITVANSKVSIASGTTANAKTSIQRTVDYGPMIMMAQASITQRIANQTCYMGMSDDPSVPQARAWFRFDGASANTVVMCETSYANPLVDTEQTTVTIPSGLTTASMHRYRVELAQEYCAFYINEVLVATHRNHIPSPYAYMDLWCGWINGASVPASSSTIDIDNIFINNADALQIQAGFSGLNFSVAPQPCVNIPLASLSSSADMLVAYDVSGYRYATVQLSGVWAGNVFIKGSNDGVNWINLNFINLTGNNGSLSSASTTGLYAVGLGFKLMKISFTYTSGTVAGILTISNDAPPMTTMTGYVTANNTAITTQGSLFTTNIASGKNNTTGAIDVQGTSYARSTFVATCRMDKQGILAIEQSADNILYAETVRTYTTTTQETITDISAISRATTVVTVTTAVAHNLQVGMTVYISGVTDSVNFATGSYVITAVASGTTFTYTQAGSAVSSSGGTAKSPIVNIANLTSPMVHRYARARIYNNDLTTTGAVWCGTSALS